MTATTATPMLRLSTVRDCPRRAIFEATGAPERELFDSEQRIMYRGKSIGRDYIVMLATANQWKVWVDSGPAFWLPPELRAASADEADVIAEKRIRWSLGVGHADLFVKETKTIVEVLSSAHASEQMTRSKLLQAVMYVDHDDEAENAALIVISPTDLSEDRTVVMPGTRQWDDLLGEARDRVQDVVDWHNNGDAGRLPHRVCAKPSEARSHFCRHAEHCFEGWEPPPIEVLEADEDLIAAVTAFDRAKAARARIGGEDKQLEAEQKAAQAIIEKAEIPAGMDVQVGPYVVKRTAVQRKPSFQWEKAEAAGLFEPGMFDDSLWKQGASYSTYRTELVGDRPQEDFGDVPWTDADLVADGGLHS